MIDLTKTVLGIEFGSTRIKAVLIDDRHVPVASGSYGWENRLSNGVWTYPMEEIHGGLQSCVAGLKADLWEKRGVELRTAGAIGVSAMMHGYLPFDKNGRQLTEFRTWRNTMTGEAAGELTELFGFHIPQRWTVAHLYQAILNGEAHVKEIDYLTTLAGYMHWRLSGERLVGVGEASGIVPLASGTLDYDPVMTARFDRLVEDRRLPWKLRDILPKAVPAGQRAGRLTREGALLLDPSGVLQPGIPLAPCEGDAGTGMTAVNALRCRTGNVSAGTSAFAMLVADHPLGVRSEVDMVTTPTGLPVAMVHSSNCTSDINAWLRLFSEFAEAIGMPLDAEQLFGLLFHKALEGEPDGGGLLNYNYFSGEGLMRLNDGRPVFARAPDSSFTLANFMRTQLMSALVTLKIGMDILTAEEHIKIDRLCAHGGFFRTAGVGQRILSAALGVPVTVMDTAGEGGPYGMALLGAYMLWKDRGETLEDYLDRKVFSRTSSRTLTADSRDIAGFAAFAERYKKALPLEQAALRVL